MRTADDDNFDRRQAFILALWRRAEGVLRLRLVREILEALEGALCAELIRLRVSYHQQDETLSQHSLV